MKHRDAVCILFVLNFIDALITIVWVRTGIASEANTLMAALLDNGVQWFLLVKIGMGVITCLTLLYGSQYKLAKIGVAVALIAYAGAIGSHVLTGMVAFGTIN